MKLQPNTKHIISVLILLLILACIPTSHASKIDKILQKKYYLHRDTAFNDYKVLNKVFPAHNDSHYLQHYFEQGIHEVPLSWITAKINRDITLHLNYTFTFSMYAFGSHSASARLVASFWRYRDGEETFLWRSRTSGIFPCSECNGDYRVWWYDNINGTINFKKNDRLIFKLYVKVINEGNFYFGFDCEQYPSYIFDPIVVKKYAGGYTNPNGWYDPEYAEGEDDGSCAYKYYYASAGAGVYVPIWFHTFGFDIPLDAELDSIQIGMHAIMSTWSSAHPQVQQCYKILSATVCHESTYGGSLLCSDCVDKELDLPQYYVDNTTPEMLNNEDFEFWCQLIFYGKGSGTGHIDSVWITVVYTSGGWNTVETWNGELIGRGWFLVEVWNGIITVLGWHPIEMWHGQLTQFNFINIIMWIAILGGTLFLIIYASEKSGHHPL